jgi:hypothetical protein
MNELEIFANQFKEWRGNRQHIQYPKSFWDKARELSKHFSIVSIAKACGINPNYLRYKLPAKPKPLSFTQVQVASSQSQVAIEFINSNSCTMTVRFQADHMQLTQMLLSLSGRAS